MSATKRFELPMLNSAERGKVSKDNLSRFLVYSGYREHEAISLKMKFVFEFELTLGGCIEDLFSKQQLSQTLLHLYVTISRVYINQCQSGIL
jgi:hypothetical protein